MLGDTNEAVSHDELPLPDYDHLPVSSLGHRIRSLTFADVQLLRGYEAQHANRMMVLAVLDHRLDELARGATPSAGSPSARTPEAAPPAAGGNRAGPATTGPASNPPSQGDPTNPAQPRSTS